MLGCFIQTNFSDLIIHNKKLYKLIKMKQNASISFAGEDSNLNKSNARSNAAPLEQNVKNLECDGVIYKVIKEDLKDVRP